MPERRIPRRASAAPGASRERERDDDRVRGDDEFDKRDADDEFERPRRSRRSRDDDDRSEERPSRSRSRDDDDDDDRGSRRSRRSRDDEEEEDRPRRSRRSRDDDDDEPRGRRRSRDDDDDDEDDEEAGRGWKAFKNSGGGNFADKLNPDDDPSLAKFLDNEPFVVYKRHWIPSANRSYTCIASIPKRIGGSKSCPLCDIGDKPAERLAFNVAVLVENDEVLEEPAVKVFDVPAGVGADLRKKDADERKGPLDREYWEIVMTNKGKKNKKSETKVELVKERDLEDDWKIAPLSDDEIDDLLDQLFTMEEHPYVNDIDDLEKVADDIVSYRKRRDRDDDDDDDDDRPSRRRRRR